MMTDLALFIYGKIFIMNRNLFLLATLQLGRKTGKFWADAILEKERQGKK